MSALLKGAQLAEQMGVSRLFVTAMKAAGYRFQYGTQTTLRHALSPAHVAAKDRRRCGNGAAKTC